MSEKMTTERPSRRQMMVASGATVAAISAATPVIGNESSEHEIDTWTELVGMTFRLGRKGSSVKLVEVKQLDFADPNRPKRMRAPFILFFCPVGTQRMAPDGLYDLYSRKVRLNSMFLSATVVSDLSPRPIYHAVFA